MYSRLIKNIYMITDYLLNKKEAVKTASFIKTKMGANALRTLRTFNWLLSAWHFGYKKHALSAHIQI